MLVERNAHNVNRRGCLDTEPIIFVKCNDTLEYLIQKGAHVNDVDAQSLTALYHASNDNRPTIVSTLLNHGADVNLSDINDDTMLHLGAQKASLKVIKALVASLSCDVHLKN